MVPVTTKNKEIKTEGVLRYIYLSIVDVLQNSD